MHHLSQIEQMWEIDSVIDETALDSESIKIPQLHSKYFKIFSEERIRLWKLTAEYKKLKFEKQIFLESGDEKTNDKGWKLPPRGQLIKQRAQEYMENDQEIIDFGLRVAMQNEKIELLESIIDSLNRRSFTIKNAIEFLRWKQGG